MTASGRSRTPFTAQPAGPSCAPSAATPVGPPFLRRALPALATLAVFALLSWASLGVYRMPTVVPADAPADKVSAARAFEHSLVISRVPHPTGSEENRRVRDYILGQLRAFGVEPSCSGPLPSTRSSVRW